MKAGRAVVLASWMMLSLLPVLVVSFAGVKARTWTPLQITARVRFGLVFDRRVFGKKSARRSCILEESMIWRTPLSWPPGRKTRSYSVREKVGEVYACGLLMLPAALESEAIMAW